MQQDEDSIVDDTIAFLDRVSSNRQFIEQYSLFHSKVQSYFAFRLNGDTELCKDLTATVFTKAFEKFDQYNDDLAFSTWVYTIARNTLIDYFRVHKKAQRADIDKALEVEDPDADFFSVIDAKLSTERIREALQQIPDTQATAVYRRHFLLEEIDDVAKALGKSNQATRQLISRGCRALAATLRSDA